MMILLFCLVLFVVASSNYQGNPFLKKKCEVKRWKYTNEQLNSNKRFSLQNNPFEYSGFIELNNTERTNLYYVYYPAQNKPENEAETILWLNGGPGCSSQTGNFIELGPWGIDPETLEMYPREYTWNKNYNLLFLDQPAGAGFSYPDDGHVTSQKMVAEEVYEFLTKFFNQYSRIKKSMWIFGESYAGKYIPSISKYILEQREITLNGVGIGDGLSHPVTQFTNVEKFLSANGLIDGIDEEMIIDYQNAIRTGIEKEEYEKAMEIYDEFMGYIQEKGGNFNVYDIREYGSYDLSRVDKFVDLPQIRELMHTGDKEFRDCSGAAWEGLAADIPHSAISDIQFLLKSGLDVTFFNGQFDFIINQEGTRLFLEEMSWKYQSEYVKSKRRIWKLSDDSMGGYVKSYENLRYVIIPSAGHLNPMDQPQRLLEMVENIIEKKNF